MTDEFLVLVNHIFVAVLVDCLLLLLILLLCTKRYAHQLNFLLFISFVLGEKNMDSQEGTKF